MVVSFGLLDYNCFVINYGIIARKYAAMRREPAMDKGARE